MLASFPESGVGIVATVPAADGIDIVGTAIFVIGSDPATCEFAITIAADYGGAGLGRTLLTALIDAAKRRGLKEMEGFVLAANKPMLGLAARVGFSVSHRPRRPFHSPLPSASLAPGSLRWARMTKIRGNSSKPPTAGPCFVREVE